MEPPDIPWRLVPAHDKRKPKKPGRFEEEEKEKFPCEVCVPKEFKTMELLARHCRGLKHKKNEEAWLRANNIQVNTEENNTDSLTDILDADFGQQLETGDQIQVVPTPIPVLEFEEQTFQTGDPRVQEVVQVVVDEEQVVEDEEQVFEEEEDEDSEEFIDTADLSFLGFGEDFLKNLNEGDYFDIVATYNSPSEVIPYDRDSNCKPVFKNSKSKAFSEIFLKNIATKQLQQDILDFIATNYNDPQIPTTNYFLDQLTNYHNESFQVYEQVINEEKVSFFQIREILIKILESEVEMKFFFEEKEEKSEENHFQMWKRLQHEEHKTIMLKIFIDEYEVTKRRKTKCNGIVMTLANFRPKYQRSIESKYLLSILPPDKKHNNFYYFIFNVLIKQILDLQQNPIRLNEETYHVELYCLEGDHPGQAQAAGLTGHPSSLMPNIKCKGGLLPHEAPCAPRDAEESYHKIMSQSGIIQKRLKGTVTKARGLLKLESFTYPPSPFWLIMRDLFYERLGTCRMHTLYEGIAPLILQSYGNEHSKQFRDKLEVQLQRIPEISNLGITSFFFETKNRITNQDEVRLSLFTAAEKKRAMYILWNLVCHNDDFDNEEKKILHIYMQIDNILCREELNEEDINQLDGLTLEFKVTFQERYENSDWTTLKRPKFDSLVHFGDTIRNLGLADSYDTVYGEAVWFQNKKTISNNKNLRRDCLLKFEQRRSHKEQNEESDVFKPKSHVCAGKCPQTNVGHWYSKIGLRDGHKIQVGEFIQINWTLPDSDETQGPMFVELTKIYWEEELKTLLLYFQDYDLAGLDQFNQQLVKKTTVQWTSWGRGTKLTFRKCLKGKFNNQGFEFVNKFWEKKFNIEL